MLSFPSIVLTKHRVKHTLYWCHVVYSCHVVSFDLAGIFQVVSNSIHTRFLNICMGILSCSQSPASVTMLLNNGILGLTQSITRIFGEYKYVNDSSNILFVCVLEALCRPFIYISAHYTLVLVCNLQYFGCIIYRDIIGEALRWFENIWFTGVILYYDKQKCLLLIPLHWFFLSVLLVWRG